MKIGKYTLHIINSGYIGLDGGAMFGVIPKPLWEKTNPADESNRIKLITRNLLLINDTRKILIDTGMGDKWDDKSRKIYAINQEKESLNNSLSNLKLRREDITDVILTHLHFDHTGGSTKLENGKVVPAFPNARYYIQKKNYEWASNPSERDRRNHIKEDFVPLRNSGVLQLIDQEEKFDDEIELIVLDGHTFAQQLVKISDGSETLLFSADLFPTISHIPIPYIMSFDLQPLVTIEDKKKILSKAVDENWKLFFEHDPETVYATVVKGEKGFRVNERFKSL